jgi:hypothetical protein
MSELLIFVLKLTTQDSCNSELQVHHAGHRDSSSVQEYDKRNALYFCTLCIATFNTELFVTAQSVYPEVMYLSVG